MQLSGFEESKEVLVSVLRACSKEGDIEESEKIWEKLQRSSHTVPSQAFVYKMEVYAKIGEHMRSLEVFRSMQEQLGSASTSGFHKIVKVLCKAEAVELPELVMKEFVESGKKPLMPSFIDLMDTYFTLDMHKKLEYTFFQSLEKCNPNRTIYNIYLKSLVHVGNLDKAEEILREMQNLEAVGVDAKSCNVILRGYLDGREYVKAEKIYALMKEKKYHIESDLIESLERVLKSNEESVKNPVTLKLSKVQREALVGLFLGGLQIESDENRKSHMLVFKFNEDSDVHKVLKKHLSNDYYEWLDFSSKQDDKFRTISHAYFAWSPSGRQLACGSMDGSISVFDVQRKKFLHHLDDHTMPVRSLAYSPLDPRVLVSGSDDGCIHMYDAEGKMLFSSISGHSSWVLSIDVSPDGAAIASGSSDRTVKLWDPKMRAAIQTMTNHTDQVWGVKFEGAGGGVKGSLLASVSDDKSISLYNYS